MAAGERVRAPFERILDDIFYVLEEYVIDLELRTSDDMSDDDLLAQVRGALEGLGQL